MNADFVSAEFPVPSAECGEGPVKIRNHRWTRIDAVFVSVQFPVPSAEPPCSGPAKGHWLRAEARGAKGMVGYAALHPPYGWWAVPTLRELGS